MIDVLPAPVAPTMATLSPAEILKSTSRRTQSPSLYAKETLSMVISPRTLGSRTGLGGSALLGRASRRRHNLSARATRALRVLPFFHRAWTRWADQSSRSPHA